MTKRRFRVGLACGSVAVACAIVPGFSRWARAQDAARPAAPSAPMAAQPAPATTQKAAQPSSDVPAPTVVLKPGEVPAIKFDQATWDFGRIQAGPEVAHDFWFTNTGTGPLEILKVRPSCGCTVPGEYDRIVQPGKSGKIPLRLHTAKLPGKVSKSTVVHTNVAGADSGVQINIIGETWLAVDVTPRSAAFQRVSGAKASAAPPQKLTVVNNVENQKMVPTDLKSSNPAFKAEITPLEPGKKFELAISLVSSPEKPIPKGNIMGTISMMTGIPDSPTLEVQVSALITGDVDVQPENLQLFSDRTSEQRRSFTIQNGTPTSLVISEVTAPSPDVKITMQETAPGSTYRMEVVIPPTYKPAASGDKISFKTNVPTAAEMTIPVVERQLTPPAPAPKPAAAAAPAPPPSPTGTMPPAPKPAEPKPLSAG